MQVAPRFFLPSPDEPEAKRQDARTAAAKEVCLSRRPTKREIIAVETGDPPIDLGA